MRISTAFLADHAEVKDSRLSVSGGVWTSLIAPSFPARHGLTLVLLLEPEAADTDTVTRGGVEVLGPAGDRVASAEFDLDLHVPASQVPVVMTVMAEFAGAGRHQVRLSLAGSAQCQVGFEVIEQR